MTRPKAGEKPDSCATAGANSAGCRGRRRPGAGGRSATGVAADEFWLGGAVRLEVYAEHTITISPREQRTELTHTEHFRGLLVPLLRGTLVKTHQAFLAMDAALARRATAPAGA